jgi:hypothetical protein
VLKEADVLVEIRPAQGRKAAILGLRELLDVVE